MKLFIDDSYWALHSLFSKRSRCESTYAGLYKYPVSI